MSKDYNNDKPQAPQIDKGLLIKYIKCEDNDEAIKFAEKAGEYLAKNGFTTAKLRNIFGEIENIQFSNKGNVLNKKRLALLNPKLAYLIGREDRYKKDVVEYFKKILSPMIEEIMQQNEEKKAIEYYNHFVNFVKAIIAYHKYHGGK